MVEIPNLDDREFEDVLEETKRQLPVHTDEWTDHNAHDTGITILEMLAWLSDSYSYQLNRITDKHREKYLRLLGIERRPPRCASARVRVDPPEGSGGQTVPAGEQLLADDGSGKLKTFETTTDTTITEAELVKIVSHAGGDIVNTTAEAKSNNTRFRAFGDAPAAGDALYLGFDRDPFVSAGTLSLTFDLYDENLPEPASHGDEEGVFEPSVELVWEFPTSYSDWEADDSWKTLSVEVDSTESFYEGGDVVLETDSEWDQTYTQSDPVGILQQDPGLFWIRCRIERAGYEFPPQFDTIRLNMLEVTHQTRIEDEILEKDDGTLETTYRSNQEFFFQEAPVLDARITVDDEPWEEVEDLDRSDSLDKHYVLNQRRGSVTFGDGENGRKPPVRSLVRAAEYVHGGGTDGNVSANTEWEFSREDGSLGGVELPSVSLASAKPATGGSDVESIEEAMDRFKRDFKRPYRAATLDDYVYVATHTPGLRFGRAHATTTERRAGDQEFREIEVVVVPYSPHPKPEPSAGFLEAVQQHLERTRLVTDVVSVEEPTYVDLDLDIVISALSGYTDAELTEAISERLVRHLHPIEGDGWPFGYPLYISEVTDVIEALPGIRAVEHISVSARGEQRINEYGDVLIDESALFALTERNIRVSIGE